MAAREFDSLPARQELDQFAHQRCLARIRGQATNADDDWLMIFHEPTDESSIGTSVSSPAASSSSNRDGSGLSRSRTPISFEPFINGTTISEFDALSQAMCPGNSCTFGTIIVSHFAAAVPQTPSLIRIRTHAGFP